MRIAVIDRSASVRALLRRVVAQAEGLEIGLCGEEVERGISLLRRQDTDVAVVGLHPIPTEEIEALSEAISNTVVPMLVLTPPLGEVEWKLATLRKDSAPPQRVVVLAKPDRPPGWEKLKTDLPDLVRDLGRSTVGGRPKSPAPDRFDRAHAVRILAIGASAGGPAAVCETLRAVGEDLRQLGVLIVQHIEAEFVDGFVNWLAREVRWTQVGQARHGEILTSGMTRVAPAKTHLVVSEGDRLILDSQTPARQGHLPSVDFLFEALAQCCPSEVAAVLLSGMGCDGVEGLLALRRAGALTFAQDARSSAVFGMPGAAISRGAAMVVLPPAKIGKSLGEVLRRRPR